MKKSTKSRLTRRQIAVFPGNTLFDKIARTVCRSGALPGKELFEAWEVARRVRRQYRGVESWIWHVDMASWPTSCCCLTTVRLRAKGYSIITRTIPEEIAPKNRLLLAHPK